MAKESELYELVWGEAPPPSRPKEPSTPSRPIAARAPAPAGRLSPKPAPREPSQSGDPVLARLEAIEASMAVLLDSARQIRASAEFQQMVLMSLEAAESRMKRVEKGLLRSLEYLESRIAALERR